jgi:iron(III) transport system substrate-binding protein
MGKKTLILILVACVIAIPFIFRKDNSINIESEAEERLVIITAHSEAIRREYTVGFSRWYQNRTGKRVQVEWRVPGGTSDAIKYIDATYLNAFRVYWEKTLNRKWNKEIQSAFANSKLQLDTDPNNDTPTQAARRAFLDANITCGVDILFGGGVYEFGKQAEMGQLMPNDLTENPPEWFLKARIPYLLNGDELWDVKGRWIGVGLSSFGIVFNRDALKRIGYEKEPNSWIDLTDPRFFRTIALVDPMLSSPTSKTFEIIAQQNIGQAYEKLLHNKKLTQEECTSQAIDIGWLETLKIIQKMAANGRYFMESSAKAVLDVSAGSCAAAISIDHYGRYQQDNILQRSGSQRFVFVVPKGQISVTPDTIAILKGAPHTELALAFLEYVLSLEGQKLLALKVGTPGGPEQFNLRCMPITQEFYDDAALLPYRSDPELNPYKDSFDFTYHKEWTTPVVSALRFIIKAAFIDAHEELVAAWKSIIDARNQGRLQDAEAALAVLEDLSEVNYANASNVIEKQLRSGDPLLDLSLQSKLTRHFRKQYKQAHKIAEGVQE